jgi:hypothetical protein
MQEQKRRAEVNRSGQAASMGNGDRHPMPDDTARELDAFLARLSAADLVLLRERLQSFPHETTTEVRVERCAHARRCDCADFPHHRSLRVHYVVQQNTGSNYTQMRTERDVCSRGLFPLLSELLGITGEE